MNKRYLPVIASVLILAITVATFQPAFAAVTTLRALAMPTLVVFTIPEDDQIRQTGMMVFADTRLDFQAIVAAGGVYSTVVTPGKTNDFQDLLAQYKLLVSYNGVPINPTSLFCQIDEKDKANPLKDKQGPWENLKTIVVDKTSNFVCKVRWGKPGVGVLDVYYTGPLLPQYISDYVVAVYATLKIGSTLIYGSDIQDLCILGWSMYGNHPDGVPVGAAGSPLHWLKPDGSFHTIYPDPLDSVVSCETAALWQKHVELVPPLPIPWT